MLRFLQKPFRSSLTKVPCYNFTIHDREYYHKNFEEALLRSSVQRRIVKVPTIDPKEVPKEIEIYGVPLNRIEEQEEILESSLKSFFTKKEKFPLFLQVDPTNYLYHERKVTRKADTPLVNNEEVQKLLHADPIHPYTWEETMVRPEVIAKYLNKEIKKSEAHENDKENEGWIDPSLLIDYVERMGVSHEKADERVDLIVNVVNERILGNQPIDYYELNNILFYSIVGENKVILGGMPKILKRLVLGNSLSLENLKEIFKHSCENLKAYRKQRPSLSLSDVAPVSYPEVFHASEVIYMTILMKEIARKSNTGFRAFVGIDFVEPIADSWKNPEIDGVQFSDIIGFPERLESDTVSSLIEKQVILDVLLEENVWGLSYVHNKFPYLSEEETGKGRAEKLRKLFLEKHDFYLAEKDKILKK